jgi:hypothetical protein
MFAWYVYFSKEVKIVLNDKYKIPDSLCQIIANFALGIHHIQSEAHQIRDFKMFSMILGEEEKQMIATRVMKCRDFYWGTPFATELNADGYQIMDNINCIHACKVIMSFDTTKDDTTLWNLKLMSNMFDLLFEANSSTRFNNDVLHEVKIAILCQQRTLDLRDQRMVNHLRDSLFQITRGKQFSMWYGDDKYNYGYFGTPTAVIILQHIEDIGGDLFDRGYKFGRSYSESDRCTLWMNRIYSRTTAELRRVVLNLLPYAQFSNLMAVNELVRVASKNNLKLQ